MCNTDFGKEFVWGAATSAYQIEGGHDADGKGPSIWDDFCRQPGRIKDGATGDRACDHYHRYQEDIGIMQSIGLQAYRFSLSWPRIMPEGRGPANKAGLDFYDRLTDGLLAAGIRPFATLYHWDMPSALHKKGGWEHPDAPRWFEDYTVAVAARLGDRIRDWITFNEMLMFISLGYETGVNAPGLKLPAARILSNIRGVLLSHGRAVSALRACSKAKPKIGVAHAGPTNAPKRETPEHIEALRRTMFEIPAFGSESGISSNVLFSDPIYLGRFTEQTLRFFGKDFPNFTAEDMRLIGQPLDFFGLNFYTGFRIDIGADGQPVSTTAHPYWDSDGQKGKPGAPRRTHFDWLWLPEGLRWGCKLFYERYRKPIYVTENGISWRQEIAPDGRIRDTERIEFMRQYLAQLRMAINEGVPVRGYFEWSMMDVFEWLGGYNQRFGLVHVDYNTLRRTIKDSGLWYRDVIACNGRTIPA